MARPVKWRRIEHLPAVSRFSPDNMQATGAETILNLEELEAIRLKDLEGLEQNECADRMAVSRPTFQRILLSARAKVADSLVNGKAIHITGGHFTQNLCRLQCLSCGHEWTDRCESLDAGTADTCACPNCGGADIACGQSCGDGFGRGRCHRHGRMHR